jgi:hypothetical protein
MKKEIKSIYKDKNTIINYDIPENYKRSNPDYFTPAIELIKESTYLNYYEFPIVIYLFACNESGDVFNSGVLVDWTVSNSSNYNTKPNHTLEQYTQQFKEYFKDKSVIKKTNCIKYISDSKLNGFTTLKISVGIWTNESILCETVFDYDLGFDKIAKEYYDVSIKNKSICYENAFLTKHCLEEIFVESQIINDNNASSINQNIINLLFENKSSNKDSFNKIFKISAENPVQYYMKLMCVLENNVDLVKTTVMFTVDLKVIEVSFISFLSVMVNYEQDDFKFKSFDSEEYFTVKEIKDNNIEFRFELTDRMIKLAKQYNKKGN